MPRWGSAQPYTPEPSAENQAAAVARADELSAAARRAGRWYARFLLIFAAVTFVLCLGFGLIDWKLGITLLTPVCLLIICLLIVWALRQRFLVAGVSRIHAIVMLAWSLAWIATVQLDVRFDSLRWWILGGLATALPPLIGAQVVLRRTR